MLPCNDPPHWSSVTCPCYRKADVADDTGQHIGRLRHNNVTRRNCLTARWCGCRSRTTYQRDGGSYFSAVCHPQLKSEGPGVAAVHMSLRLFPRPSRKDRHYVHTSLFEPAYRAPPGALSTDILLWTYARSRRQTLLNGVVAQEISGRDPGSITYSLYLPMENRIFDA